MVSDAGHTEVFNPATGARLGSLANTPAERYPDIFNCARAAQRICAEKTFAERRRELHKMAVFIRDHSDELARIISEGNGKTRQDALVSEVLPCALACEWYGKNAARVLRDERREMSSLVWVGKRSRVTYEALGVVGIISPWNYPLSIPFEEVVMGLMAGNAIVLKVASATPLIGKAYKSNYSAMHSVAGCWKYRAG
nr:aldehyde dehydrogenase family protein [Oleiphilus messinensis]